MKVLVINCGSSSLKFQLFDMASERVLAKGIVERIGGAESAGYTYETGTAALALEMFAYRVKKYIGAYTAVLCGVDAFSLYRRDR